MSNLATQHATIDQLNDEAWKINRTDPKRSQDLAHQALNEAKENDYLKGITYATAALGASNVWLSNYDQALNHLFEAQKNLQELGDKEKEAQVVYQIFCAFYFLSDYQKAIEYAQQILVLAEENNDLNAKANGFNGIGTIYYTIKENDKAIQHLLQGYEICKNLSDKPLLARILDGLGTAYYNSNKIDEAIHYKQLSLEAARESGVKNIEAYALNGLALIYRDKGDLNYAKQLFSQSLNLRVEIEFKSGITESLFHLGDLHFRLNDFTTAKNFLVEALGIAKEIESKEYLYQIHECFAKLYEAENDLVNFKKHFSLYFSSKEDYFNEKTRQKIKSSEMQMRMKQMEMERNLLEKKNTELENFSKDLVLLSDLGKKITSLLSIESINQTVYEILNTIMDADGFGIGIISEQQDKLFFPGYIEGGVVEEGAFDSLDDDDLLAVTCFKKGIDIFINDFETEYIQYVKKRNTPQVGKAMTSIIYLPLVADNKKIGVLTVQSFNKNAYTSHHLNILRNLGVYCVIALQNANMYEQLEDKVIQRTKEVTEQKEQLLKSYETTRLLSEIGQQITLSTNFEAIFKKLYSSVNQLMDAGCFGVRIYVPEKNRIEYRFEIEKGNVYDEISVVSMDNDNNYSVWCVKNKEVIFINDNILEHKKWVKQIHVVSGDMPHSLIFYPMMIGDRVLGVITVQSFERNAYKPHHIDVLKTLGSYTAIALENANLIENLEERVKERTDELVKQKEKIEQTYKNTKLLSEIGKDITSQLSVEKINEVVYEKVNKLMNAEGFGIGLFNEKENTLSFPGYIESGKRLDGSLYDCKDENRMAVVCFNHSKEILINNFAEEHSLYVKRTVAPMVGRSVSSLIYLPVFSNNKKIGVITVQSFENNSYTDYDVNILRSLAVYVGIALDNAGLYEHLEEKVEERTAEIEKAYENTRLLSQIAKDISSSLDTETIIEKVYHNVNSLMDAECFGIGIFQPETSTILMPGFIEKGEKMEDFYYNINDERLASWCFRNQKEIFINDYSIEYINYIKGIQKPVSGTDSSSIIYLPLYLKDKVIGVITVQSFTPNAYTEYHLDILRALSHSIATALENAMLYSNLEEKVKERTAEVVKQKEIIEEKNKHITDSIIYAKRIQEAILPAEEVFSSYLQNSFVLYKPKDIVSGDFYWIERKKNKILFAVVDCTGHGVPGAFMSIIGFNGLNQIVNEYNISQPAEILNHLNKIITNTLRQRKDETKIRDGMDMSICCIDLENNKLEFAGANNPIFIVRNNEVLEVMADKHPIGNYIGEDEFRFTNHNIELQSNDRIYLASDGYADQFGGPRGKKLKYNQFREILLKNKHLPMKDQKEMLNTMFEEWRGDLEQIDDVCVIGISI